MAIPWPTIKAVFFFWQSYVKNPGIFVRIFKHSILSQPHLFPPFCFSRRLGSTPHKWHLPHICTQTVRRTQFHMADWPTQWDSLSFITNINNEKTGRLAHCQRIYLNITLDDIYVRLYDFIYVRLYDFIYVRLTLCMADFKRRLSLKLYTVHCSREKWINCSVSMRFDWFHAGRIKKTWLTYNSST